MSSYTVQKHSLLLPKELVQATIISFEPTDFLKPGPHHPIFVIWVPLSTLSQFTPSGSSTTMDRLYGGLLSADMDMNREIAVAVYS